MSVGGGDVWTRVCLFALRACVFAAGEQCTMIYQFTYKYTLSDGGVALARLQAIRHIMFTFVDVDDAVGAQAPDVVSRQVRIYIAS